MDSIVNAWPIVAASAGIVFGAGVLVEKVRNGKYVRKETYFIKEKNHDERWVRIEKYMEQNRKDHETIFRLLRDENK